MFSADQISAMDDREIGTHASGGYGPAKRQEFIASIRRLADAERSHRADVETAKDQIRRLPLRDALIGSLTPSNGPTADDKVWG